MENDNPFQPLADAFPDGRFDDIGRLFDEAVDFGAGDDQWKLTGLALLLSCLENAQHHADVNGSDLAVPVLCKLQALQAAYRMGKSSSQLNNNRNG